MLTINQINEILDEVTSLKLVTQAYTEISAIKLQKIRAGIERNRIFFQEVAAVFRMVEVAANQRSGKNISTNKKGAVSILLTSNQHFYGTLEHQLIKFFVEHTSSFNTNRIIVGATAKRILPALQTTLPAKFYIFSSDIPPVEELRQLIPELSNYEQILVYYCRMQTVLLQTPSVVDLLQKPPERYLEDKKSPFQSIFEPEIDEMIQFFDTQINTLLLEQILLESELARTAARLTAMNQAQLNADDLIKQNKTLLLSAKRLLDNNRLLDIAAGMFNWRKNYDS